MTVKRSECISVTGPSSFAVLRVTVPNLRGRIRFTGRRTLFGLWRELETPR